MTREGMTLLLETAKFWISRAVMVNDRLEIHDVIGPDEYTEHVNNNAFTNYMARYNVEQALGFARRLGCGDDTFIHRAEHFYSISGDRKCSPMACFLRMIPS